jgi:hypothetical protein
MAEVALRAMEAVVMATTEEPEWKGRDSEYDELRDHTSDTAEEEAETPPPPPGGGSCGPNGGRQATGTAEEFIWSGEGPGRGEQPGFGKDRKDKPAGLIDVISSKQARRKRKEQGSRQRGSSYTHTLPKNLQNALKKDTQRLGN